MNTTTAVSSITSSRRSTSSNTAGDLTIERALGLLAAGGVTFEVVERCPTTCAFCDDSIPHAA